MQELPPALSHLTLDMSAAPVRMTPLQALTKGPRWHAEAMRSYRSGLLLWITRGQGRITLAGVTSGFGAHNAIWIPAGTMHGLTVTSAVYGTACFLDPSVLPESMPGIPLHLRARDATAQGALTIHLDDLQREVSGTRPAADQATACHIGLISVWLERMQHADPSLAQHSAAERLVARYTDMVERQVMTGQGAGEYAEALGVTISHLTRACRATCGRTAQDLLTDRIMFEARRLLWDTDLPVKRIAVMLGFGSAAYFTRAFKARAGLAPSAFRQTRPARVAQAAMASDQGAVPPRRPAPSIPARSGRAGWPAPISRTPGL